MNKGVSKQSGAVHELIGGSLLVTLNRGDQAINWIGLGHFVQVMVDHPHHDGMAVLFSDGAHALHSTPYGLAEGSTTVLCRCYTLGMAPPPPPRQAHASSVLPPG